MLRHRYEDFPSPLKAHLPRRKAPVASGLRVLPTLPQPLLPGPLALGASGERGRAPGRWSGRRSGGCGGASAGRSPLRAARTPTCCAMGPSPPTSLHEPAATRPTEASALRPRPWGCRILRDHVPERPDPLLVAVLDHPRCWKLPSATGTGTALPQAAPSSTATSEPSLEANGITA
jgi:hypothetical protein